MTDEELVNRLERIAQECTFANPAAAGILYVLCGSILAGSVGVLNSHCRVFALMEAARIHDIQANTKANLN